MHKFYLVVLSCALLLAGCKKEEDGTQPGADTGPRQLLNGNSGFREVYLKSDSALLTNPSSALFDLYKPQEISVLADGKTVAFSVEKHVSHSTGAAVYLGTVNLTTGQLTAPVQATNYPAPDVSYPEIAGFVPHTSTYYYTSFQGGNPSAWDIKGSGLKERFINWGGYPRVTKTGDYVMNDYHPFYWKNKKGRYFAGSLYDGSTANASASVFEPLPSGDRGVLFLLRPDSLAVAIVDTIKQASKSAFYKVKIDGKPAMSSNLDFLHLVRTTPTGSRIAVCFMRTVAGVNHYWTATYDGATKTAALVLNNVTLPYSGEGSDYDIDDSGNLYYSGYADSGKNRGGVSIYKHTQSGSSLVGADNFLRQGEIMLLRYEAGKVWLGISLYKDKEGKQVRPQWSLCQQQ